ncbi:uncharacterized protein SAPINGB_P003867 [Magnusiomyces paraingens]|uniref:Trafficking protein particle complex II-specific subunit 65 IgD3 domain-containing protein n=1 Tax=Magnusiomyces paraingens TaxID=2606893 RepID=A0A5E8BSL7_9ASCO|nr:uncharacterized protein SAPINGB_P003867 [Saprochaete ingens]VVT54021.1 unnamed protein product [Saprochaete ingens]
MSERFLISNGALSLHVPSITVDDDSSNTNPISILSNSKNQSSPARTAVFYDEKLVYYIQLKINESQLNISSKNEKNQDVDTSISCISDLSGDDFKRFISTLKIVVDVKISGVSNIAVPDSLNEKQKQNFQLQAYELFTSALDSSELVYSGKSSLKDEHKCATWVAVWKVSTVISHPRARLFKPEVIISVNASENVSTDDAENVSNAKLVHTVSMANLARVTHEENNQGFMDGSTLKLIHRASTVNAIHDKNQDDKSTKFLEEFEPVEDTNLFAPLHSDQSIKSIRSRLAINRLISDFSKTPTIRKDNTQAQYHLENDSIESCSNRNSKSAISTSQLSNVSNSTANLPISTISCSVSFQVFPAVNLRLRCTKATGMQDSIVSILEIDNNENAPFNVVIKSATLDFTAGSAVEFGNTSFPLWLSPGESCSIAYHLSHPDAGLPQTRVKPITIILNAIPVLNCSVQFKESEQKSKLIQSLNVNNIGPEIVTKWDTIVDFGVVAPPSHGNSKITAPVSFASASGGVKKLLRGNETANFSSIKSQQSSPGSSNTAMRTIAPKEREEKLKTNEKIISSYVPVLDQVSLRKLYGDRALNGLSGVGIVSLMNDVRIGPLAAQACYETQIQMMALAPGQFTLEGLTIVDLITGDSYECGKLLDVIVSD